MTLARNLLDATRNMAEHRLGRCRFVSIGVEHRRRGESRTSQYQACWSNTKRTSSKRPYKPPSNAVPELLGALISGRHRAAPEFPAELHTIEATTSPISSGSDSPSPCASRSASLRNGSKLNRTNQPPSKNFNTTSTHSSTSTTTTDPTAHSNEQHQQPSTPGSPKTARPGQPLAPITASVTTASTKQDPCHCAEPDACITSASAAPTNTSTSS